MSIATLACVVGDFGEVESPGCDEQRQFGGCQEGLWVWLHQDILILGIAGPATSRTAGLEAAREAALDTERAVKTTGSPAESLVGDLILKLAMRAARRR